jgi:hypothetical protein
MPLKHFFMAAHTQKIVHIDSDIGTLMLGGNWHFSRREYSQIGVFID